MTRAGRFFGFLTIAAVCAASLLCVAKLTASGADDLHTAIGWTAVSAVLLLAAFGSFFNIEIIVKGAFLGAVTVLAVAIGYIIALRYDLFVYFEDTDAFRRLIAEYDSYAVLIYLTIQFLQVTVLPLPATLTTIAGIAVFGIPKTVLYSSAAIIAGSMVAFALGRTFGVKLAIWLCGAKTVAKYRDMLKGKDTVLLYAMFLLPFFPDDLLCIIAGLGTMSYKTFFVMMVITRPVGMLWIAGVYKGAVSIPANAAGAAVWISIAVATAALFALLYKYGDNITEFMQKYADKLTAKFSKRRRKIKDPTLTDRKKKKKIRDRSASGRELVDGKIVGSLPEKARSDPSLKNGPV